MTDMTWRGTDFYDETTGYYLSKEDITADEQKHLQHHGYDFDDEAVTFVRTRDAELVLGDRMFEFPQEVDEDYQHEILDDCLGDAYSYLLFAFNVRWDGADGWKKFKDKYEVFDRDYEHTIVIVRYNGRALKLWESSHDCPMGCTQYVVALTKEEDEALDEMSFEEVRNFVQKEADMLAKETVEKIPE